MNAVGASVACDRFREQASLSLDGELSQLERRMLDAHLARCPSCSAFAVEVTAFTEDLRAAPLERPRRPIVVQRPRRIATARLQVGIAGYLQRQTTAKTGPEITAEQSRERYAINALGVASNLAFPNQRVNVGFKFFKEFANRASYEGSSFQLSGSITF